MAVPLTKKADESDTSTDFTEEVEWSTRKFLLGCLTEQAHQVHADAWEATQGYSFRPPRKATWFRRFLGKRRKRFVHSVWLVPVPHPARGPETAHTYHGAILLTSPGMGGHKGMTSGEAQRLLHLNVHQNHSRAVDNQV